MVMVNTEHPVTGTDRSVKLTVTFELDPRDLTLILSEIGFGFDHEPGTREIRAAVKETIVKAGISHLLFLARRKTMRADQLAETTDPGARQERSEHINWCRSLVNKAFKPRKPRQRKASEQVGSSLFDVL